MKLLTQKRRAYIYRVMMAAGAVALFYGLVSSSEVAVWGGLAAVVFNVMPTANTTTKPDQ